MAALNQYIYVVGGFDGTRQLASVERYDTEHGVWDAVAPISIARSALSVTSLDGRLYAMGGFDGSNFLSIVEVYDPELNIWEKGAELTTGRSGHASAVIYKPSGMPSYMDCRENDEQDKKEESQVNYENPSSHPETTFTAASSNCSMIHPVDGARCNVCNENPDASIASIPSTRSILPAAMPEPFVEPMMPPMRSSVIKSTDPNTTNQLATCSALFLNPTSAFSAILAVERSTSPSPNDKKRVRVPSFTSTDTIPPKCQTPRDDHAGQQLDREDPRKFRRLYNSGSLSLRFDEGACSSGDSHSVISSSPSGDGGIDEDPFPGPSTSSNLTSSGACAIFRGHGSDQCSVKALKNNLQRRLRAFVSGGSRCDAQLPKAISDGPQSPGSPQSTSSQEEEMDT